MAIELDYSGTQFASNSAAYAKRSPAKSSCDAMSNCLESVYMTGCDRYTTTLPSCHSQPLLCGQYPGPVNWPQSSGWLWQDGRVVVYRSHPVIYTDSKQLDIASQELLAGERFAYAAELEANWVPE